MAKSYKVFAEFSTEASITIKAESSTEAKLLARQAPPHLWDLPFHEHIQVLSAEELDDNVSDD